MLFQISLGTTVSPKRRKTENNAYAKFLGQTKCIMGNVIVANAPQEDITMWLVCAKSCSCVCIVRLTNKEAKFMQYSVIFVMFT